MSRSPSNPSAVEACDVLILGAGVLGLATAAELSRRGRTATVVDPGELNASLVAAGMIAPAMEALLDGADAERAALLRRARDLWPDLADHAGIVLNRDGAEWRGADAFEKSERLRALGFEARLDDGAAFTPEDWSVAPEAGLQALAATPGVTLKAGRAVELAPDAAGWRVRLEDGGTVAARHLVVATGAAEPPAGLPQAVLQIIRLIQPIRGQLDRVQGVDAVRVVRGVGGYLARAADGAVIGASMDVGRRDLEPDAAQSDALLAAVGGFIGTLRPVTRRTMVGVRGASPDGLPMAGPAGTPGLHLALAPRRNGWLLAPMVGRIVADGIEGETPGPDAAAFDPRRFSPPAS